MFWETEFDSSFLHLTIPLDDFYRHTMYGTIAPPPDGRKDWFGRGGWTEMVVADTLNVYA